ncbi:MAG TPA: hypothetical protein PLI05_00325 [Methanotrichaceae archaeon]|nr:hypothetical protein [Methanotrichaceae archaeon]HQF15495.1 hypothetical protein [Methanotrichaceae archaeon]HQI90230.1 hypothetical protein [Methanotrichaceae archaeon]HQJ27801.1 hypothetical protein [Methanotrichaceae archaeon]
MRIQAATILLLLLLIGQAAPVSDAARMTLPSGMNNPLTIRYPELAHAPAPAAIYEGLRATYEIVAGSPDMTTGGDVAFVGGESGAGLVQVNVVALENGQAATWTESFSPDPVLGGMNKVNFYGSVNPSGCGDFWCNPQVLRAIPDRAGDDLTVDRGTYELGGRQYDIIRFSYRSQGICLIMIYDLETGIMLHHTADFTSSFQTGEGGITTRGQNAIMRLSNLRQVNIPWKDGLVPSWARPGTTLSFQGQHYFWMPQLPDVAPTASPLSAELQIQSVHTRFIEGIQQTYTAQAIQPAYVPMISGIAQLMGFWVPKEAMSLEPGAVDSDPDTGMIVSVVDSTPEGLVMEEANNINYRLTAAYDATGKVFQTVTESYSGTATGERNELQLV